MKQIISDRLMQSIMYFLVAMLLLFYFKPGFLFKPNGKPREHGFGMDSQGYKKTLFSLQTIVIGLCFVIFALVK